MYNLYTGGYRCARRRAKSKPLLLRCGRDSAGSLGTGALGEHIAGERLVSVCDGASSNKLAA